MPIKLTWKSIFGVLSTLAGGLTASVNQLHLPNAVSAALVVIGGLVVAAERLADSKDFATVAGPGAVNEVARIRAEADALIAKAQADAEALRPLAVAYQNLVRTAQQVPSTPVGTAVAAEQDPTHSNPGTVTP